MQRENLPVHSSQLKLARDACPMREMQSLNAARHETHAVCWAAQYCFEKPFTPRSTALLHDVCALGRQIRAKLEDFTPQVYGATWDAKVTCDAGTHCATGADAAWTNS
jgi:hypothetical protein